MRLPGLPTPWHLGSVRLTPYRTTSGHGPSQRSCLQTYHAPSLPSVSPLFFFSIQSNLPGRQSNRRPLFQLSGRPLFTTPTSPSQYATTAHCASPGPRIKGRPQSRRGELHCLSLHLQMVFPAHSFGQVLATTALHRIWLNLSLRLGPTTAVILPIYLSC